MSKKENKNPVSTEKTVEKPTPAYLREDYPYQAIGDAIVDLDSLIPNGVLYEIKCPKCEISIRTQGCNIKATYERMINGVEIQKEDGSTGVEGGKGCIGCGNKELIIRMVDTSKMPKIETTDDEKTANS